MEQVSLRDRRQALLDRADLRGDEFCRAYARQADEWLSGLAERATGGNPRRLALLAVGGYGRSSLCPFSDLDVVLVNGGRRDVSTVADAIWYPVWDEGVRLDHSVRKPAEMLSAAAADLRVALGLLDARLVWGDAKVSEPLLADTVEAWRKRLGAQWVPELEAQMAERRRGAGDVAFLLEPDLKESHGGLRDVNVLRAVAVYTPQLSDYVDMAAVEAAASVLTSIRVELHRMAGREHDRLLLQDQDQVASLLDYPDADALMAAVSEAGRNIAWGCDATWRRRRFWQPAPAGRRVRRRDRAGAAAPGGDTAGDRSEAEVEPGICVNQGEVSLVSSADVAGDSSLAFRLAAVAAEMGLPMATGALHRLADLMGAPPDPWPEATRHALVRLLALGHEAIDKLEGLDQYGLLARLLPEWQAVRNKPQRNAYHTFTVDRHLLEAAANAAELSNEVDRPDLLLVGTLLHDIGKGFPGDHTEVGIEKVSTMGRRMGFSDQDTETLVTLVRQHLLLPDTATRRDLDDPATIETVAKAAGDSATLHLLAALTEADSMATGPSAWGAWKAGLVADLVDRTDRLLGGDRTPTGPVPIGDEQRRLMDEARRSGQPEVALDPPHLVVASPDRRGLLSSVTGILALHGLDVRSANVAGEDGVALERFTVEAARGRWPDADRLREDLATASEGEMTLADRLAAKSRDYAAGRRPSTARRVGPDVTVDNGASATSTVLEVRALDELGLLHRVTQAMFDCDLDVVSARVSTLGGEVVDAFYVRDASGGKVTDAGALERVTGAIRAAIA